MVSWNRHRHPVHAKSIDVCNSVADCYAYPEHNITNIILVDASEGLNGSRAEAYAKGDIRLDVICLIFA